MEAMTDRVQALATQMRARLTQLGLCYECRTRDHTAEVVWKSLQLATTDRFGPVALLEVDVARLPRKVTAAKLTNAQTLHELTASVGRPVKALNTTGVTYCVLLDPPPRQRLPRRVGLDLDGPHDPYTVPVGQGRQGDVWRSLDDLGHLLLGGTTGYGKSTWLNAALAALLTTHTSDDLRVALVDLKEIELAAWNGAPHLLGPVATEAADAAALLGLVHGELDARRALFAQAGARDLATYNANTHEPLPRLLVVVDEFTELVLASGGLRSEVAGSLARLAQKGRAFGLHLVLSTQRPDAQIVSGVIRTNVASRIAFWLATAHEYRIVLGASHPPIPRVEGRMVARLRDGFHVLQGYHLDDGALAEVAERVRGGVVACPWSADELALLRWAVEDNGGYLGRAEIANGLRCSDHQAARLGAVWQRQGWLAQDPQAGNKRRATDRLLRLLARLLRDVGDVEDVGCCEIEPGVMPGQEANE